jgi:hypothetical protein
MFARITQYKMKPGSRDAATAMLNGLKDQIMALNGMHSFITVMNEDGSGYVVSIVESEAVSDANADQVAAIWGSFAEYLEAAPTPVGFDVVANWQN